MIELNGEQLKRYELNRTVTVAPRHGNRLYAVRAQQSEATEPIPVPTREENGVIVADIPNILMERYGTITIEVISIDKHGSKNFEKRAFVVHDNKKPDDYKYEENVKPTSGGATTWSDLGESPTGGDTLTWDGNTEGLEKVSLDSVGIENGYWCRVSEVVPTFEDFSNGFTLVTGTADEVSVDNWDSSNVSDTGFGVLLLVDLMCAVVSESAVGVDIDGVVFSKTGVYLCEEAGFFVHSLTIPGYTGFPSVNKVPEEYLPETTPNYTYGTDDLTAGESELATGKLYFVYE